VLLECTEVFKEYVLPHIDNPEAKARHFVVVDVETGAYEVIVVFGDRRQIVDEIAEAAEPVWVVDALAETGTNLPSRF
jgi:hypothetical protein